MTSPGPDRADDRFPEPSRRPDLWLPPTETGLSSASATWRQPPGWAEPPTWVQPPGPTTAPAAASDTSPAGRPGPRRASTPPRTWPVARRTPPPTGTSLALRLSALLIVPMGLFLVLALTITYGTSHDRRSDPYDPAPAPGTIPPVWDLTAEQLRPDLAQASFVGSIDGTFDDSFVAAEAGVWLTVTGSNDATGTVLHAVDPDTGALRWRRALDGVLCTAEAPKAGLLCASVLQRDPATGLGTRWQLHLLDPSTGQDRATRDIDAWLTAVHWTGRVLVTLEQREPAPHAVLRAFSGSDLGDLWTRDLVDEPGQAEMFSPDRIINRPEPERPGVALDRPRLRDVGSGLVALWAGQQTAFVDAADGRLVLMPHCSRLVDDGQRLWCNEVDGASAYSYAGRPLVRVHGPRLAYPEDDGLGLDRNRAVFVGEDGAGVAVDPKTGRVGAAYTPTGPGSDTSATTSAATVGDRTFLVGDAGAMLLAPEEDRVLWRNPAITFGTVPVLLGGDQVLLGEGDLYVVDLATGAGGDRRRIDGLFAVALGDRVAEVGLDRIGLLRI